MDCDRSTAAGTQRHDEGTEHSGLRGGLTEEHAEEPREENQTAETTLTPFTLSRFGRGLPAPA